MITKIIHIDMDCYFAAIEEVENPALKNKPIAVGGSLDRGVISSCNYLARKFKVKSAMSTSKALLLCPSLIVLPVRMPLYIEISRKIKAILMRYCTKIEMFSLDEAYLDVTDSQHHQGSATLIANAIRQDLKSELGLTASAGIASLKFLAKVASDINKPDGFFVIPPQSTKQFLERLPLSKINGVGKKTFTKLQSLGLHYAGDVSRYNCGDLMRVFGKFGSTLWLRCCGVDTSQVTPIRDRKSVAVEHTLRHDATTFAACYEVVAQDLFPRIKLALLDNCESLAISSQGVKLRFSDFKTVTISHKRANLDLSYFKLQLEILLQKSQGRSVRLIGLATALSKKSPLQQLTLRI